LPKYGFVSHNFGPIDARKLIKLSKDSDYSLVFIKKLEPKNGSLGWRPGPGKFGQKCKNMPPL